MPGMVKISMKEYVKEIISEAQHNMDGTLPTRNGNQLFFADFCTKPLREASSRCSEASYSTTHLNIQMIIKIPGVCWVTYKTP